MFPEIHFGVTVRLKWLFCGFGVALPLIASANEQLMEKAGCVACHRVDQKLVGPAFTSVAARYRGDAEAPERLFEKIREGGEGVWGDLPMVSNGPEKISDADLKAMIAWILSL
jgi:cytochrome c